MLQGLHVAFSRPRTDPGANDNTKKKVYVQHLIEEQAAALSGLLERGGHVYVCGDAKHMAPDVREAFAKVLARGRAVEEGRAAVERMVAAKQYNEDVWASS